ncbi:ribonuclease Z [candidate division KSB1 bacterium]|nr:ribonuclease Z [candidate division KSB1 bacterium]
MTDQLYVVLLGTGAAAPSLSRGLPALAIVREGKIILCDCAEGTQLKLLQAGLSPAKVQTICISHLHGDHIFGLPGFLTSQQLFGRTASLTIYGPPGLADFVDMVATISKYELGYPLDVVELEPDVTSEFKVQEFQVTSKNLRHSSPCLGYRFHESNKPGKFDEVKADALGIPFGPQRGQLQSGVVITVAGKTIYPCDVMAPPIAGRIITYCTDTRPCTAALELARQSDLLIHDSTFSDAYADRAAPTFHSTSREAAEIAAGAQAKKLILWHLSIRVHGEEELNLLTQAQQLFPNTVLPHDLDEIYLRRGAGE